MIISLQEIQERFNVIKDHKPKAPKKLNELGDILASAYKHNPELANEMWQYLIDLNVADTPENAKFYIAQVFNKLTDRIKPEESAHLIALMPGRAELMILYGYDGGSMWHCLDVLLKGFLKLGTVDNCMSVIGFYFEKMNRIHNTNVLSITVIANAIHSADTLCKEDTRYTSIVHSFIQELHSIDDKRIDAYVRILSVILGYEVSNDVNELITLAHDYKFASEFIDLLWKYHSLMSVDEFAERWISYLESINEDNSQIPQLSFAEDHIAEDGSHRAFPQYEGSKMQFFVSVMKSNDNILPYYFNSVSDIANYIIYCWISEGDWDRFTRYTAQMLSNVHKQSYEYNRVKRLLERYLDAYFYKDYHSSTDEYGRSNELITNNNLSQFEKALANISVMTVDYPIHDEFHEIIKEFMLKASGNLNALNDVGFEDAVEHRNPEQRLKDYVHTFLQNGEIEHTGNSEYGRICKAIREEVDPPYNNNFNHNNQITIDLSSIHKIVEKTLTKLLIREGILSEKDSESFMEDPEDDNSIIIPHDNNTAKIDRYLELHYLHALDNEIAEFYFLHCKHEAGTKASMIAACIKKDHVDRAVELVELLLNTVDYENFSAHNSWAFEMRRVAELLAKDFTQEESYNWHNKGISDEQVQTAYELVEKIIPHLTYDDMDSVRIALMKMMPEKADNDAYIHDLMQDVVIYTTFPKPRGKGSVMNKNRISAKIIDSFKMLSQMKRLDVISQILTKFAAVKDRLAPGSFSSWIRCVTDSISVEDFCEVYRMSKPVFCSWLEVDLREDDIINVANKLGKGCNYAEFVEFRSQVISRYGLVDGLDACFHFTSDNL